ncbi:MAG TPA: hypothetical protein VK459_16935, partial [Polyangiaceae bacterium]|nr:hypothetical protein [Polyangiaceae bacterium]
LRRLGDRLRRRYPKLAHARSQRLWRPARAAPTSPPTHRLNASPSLFSEVAPPPAGPAIASMKDILSFR